MYCPYVTALMLSSASSAARVAATAAARGVMLDEFGRGHERWGTGEPGIERKQFRELLFGSR